MIIIITIITIIISIIMIVMTMTIVMLVITIIIIVTVISSDNNDKSIDSDTACSGSGQSICGNGPGNGRVPVIDTIERATHKGSPTLSVNVND